MRTQSAGREVSTAQLVDVAVGAALAGGEAMLRDAGLYQPPSVHLIREQEMVPAYLGFVTCRPFYPGEDAAEAVADMGVLPGVLGVSRLVVAWGHDDLCTALGLAEPDGGFATGFVVVDASRRGHVARWHPFAARRGPAGAVSPELATVIPEWGQEQRRPNGRLPQPVAELLATWRAQAVDPAATPAVAEAMESAGYRLCWMART